MAKNGSTRSLIATAALAGLLTVLPPGEGNSAERHPEGLMDEDHVSIVVDTAENSSNGELQVPYISKSEMEEVRAAELTDPEIIPSDPKTDTVANTQIRFIDARKAALASIGAVAVTGSDQLDGIAIVSYADEATTAAYWNIAQQHKAAGSPIEAFIWGPPDGRNGFDVYADGEIISDEQGFNTRQELAAVIDRSTQWIREGKLREN